MKRFGLLKLRIAKFDRVMLTLSKKDFWIFSSETLKVMFFALNFSFKYKHTRLNFKIIDRSDSNYVFFTRPNVPHV